MSDNEKIEIEKSELKDLIDQRVEEKIESRRDVQDLSNNSSHLEGISRREFLKKASFGTLGLGALLSPVSADYFIKDDSFSVQTSNDSGDTLIEGLYVDQNQNVDIPNGILTEQGDRVASRPWTEDNFSSIPSGVICLWSGSVSEVPGGWTLCDGSHPDGEGGVPDLQDRFVVGAGGSYGVGSTGGESSVGLSTNELPSHSHGVSEDAAGGFSQTVSDSDTVNISISGSDSHSHYFSDSASDSHSHSFSTNTRSGGSHTHSVNGGNTYQSLAAPGSRGDQDVTTAEGSISLDYAGTHSHFVSGSTSSESVSVSVSGNTNSTTVSISGSDSDTVSFSDTVSVSDHTHNVSVNSTGGGEGHENRPPYYALAYIMKL